ncbi:MAG: hypothetical protein HRU36_03210 [Rickettsiales bacterium]|nr:hypothetical protein [Rickettsiales bacterium]
MIWIKVVFFYIVILFLALPTFATDQTKAKTAKPVLHEDNLYLLQIVVFEPNEKEERRALKFSTPIDAYYANNKFYLPLSQICDSLEFAINVSPDKHIANGWFIKETNIFSLNNFNIKVLGKNYTLNNKEILFNEDDIYIESSILSKIFNIEFKPSNLESKLYISSKIAIPIQERKNREKSWKSLYTHGIDTTDFNKMEGKYQRFSMPFIDASLSDTYTISPLGSNLISYSLNMTNHMFKHMNQLFVSGTHENISNISYIVSKHDVNKKLLGPLCASNYSMGDINSTMISLVSGSVVGKGFTVKNTHLGDLTNAETTNFNGYEKPGWQIELYRNDELLKFTVIDSSGYWEFNDIPLLFGSNIFKIAFYGPRGQKKEIIKTINTSSSVLKKGQLEYDFSVNEEDRQLFDGLIKNKSTSDSSDKEKTIKFASVIKYGLHKKFSPIFGFVSDEVETVRGRQNYLTTGFITSFLQPFIIETNYAYDITDKGKAFRINALGNVLGISSSAEYLRLNNFTSDLFHDTNPIRDRSKISLNKHIKPLKLSATVKAQRTSYQDKTVDVEISNTLSRAFSRVNVSNILSYNKTENSVPSDTVKGQLILGGFIPKIRSSVRGTIYYNLIPNSKINSYTLTFTKNLAHNLSGTLDITKDNSTNGATSCAATLSWNKKRYRFGLTAGGDTKKNFFIGASLDFSLVQDPVSKHWYLQRNPAGNSGAISLRQFLDKNYNGKFDEGEEILLPMELSSAIYKDKQSINELSNFIASLPAHNESHIEYNADQLEYDQTHEYRGTSICPKPGAVHIIDIPVIRISEIEGNVTLTFGNGRVRPLYRVPVQLINAANNQVIKTFYSEFDGFYIFDKVKPGKYIVAIDPKYLEKRYLTHKKLDIEVSAEHPKVLTEQNFICSSTKSKIEDSTKATANPKESLSLQETK